MPNSTNLLINADPILIVALVLGIAFWGTIIFFIIKAIRKSHRNIQYDKQDIIQTVTANSSNKDNVFLTNDITLKVAKMFCDDFSKTIYKKIISSNDQYIELLAQIDIDGSDYCGGVSVKRGDVIDPHHGFLGPHSAGYQVFSWKKYNFQPLTDANEICQFAIAIRECIESIMNTPDAKKIMSLNAFEITFSEPHVTSHPYYYGPNPKSRYSYGTMKIHFKAPNPNYKAPAPKKWY